MANPAIDEIVDKITELTAMDLADLSKAIQDKFGVTAAVPMAAMPGMMPGAAPAAEVEEQIEFDVVLIAIGDKKIQVIKAVREVSSSLGLKEAKELVEAAPEAVVAEQVTKDEAEQTKEKLEEAGATIALR